MAPCWLGQRISRLCIVSKQVLDWTGHLSQSTRDVKQVHLIVLLANFVGHAAGPSLDLVEPVLLFIVSRLTDVDIFVLGEPPRPTLVETGYEHDETPIYDFVDAMVTVLARLDNLVLQKVLLKSMHSLFGAVIPAGVHPFLSRLVLPGSVYLSNNGFRQIVRVGDMDPIT